MVEAETAPPQVVLYTRAGCHLCEEAKRQLDQLRRRVLFDLRVIDIDQDPELQRRYNDEVPVIFICGRKAFKYRLDPGVFLRKLRERKN
ncbi:MAG TPA: glutaredoxin family protein [Terriglobia bacterium]|nr:glutaredoxin family protein [Terriglobia bacterium]